MKNCILTLLLSVPAITGYSQNYNGPTPVVKQEDLAKVSSVQDLIPLAYRYLNTWNKTILYQSVEVVASNNNHVFSSENKGGHFNKEQVSLLAKADPGSIVTFNISYNHLPVAGEKAVDTKKTYTIDLNIIAVPAYEAQYPGGQEKLATFLRDRITEKMANPWSELKFPQATVLFTISEKGEATNVRVSKSSGNETMDKHLIDALNKMEKWAPAENSKGEKIKQVFKLNFPMNTGGC